MNSLTQRLSITLENSKPKEPIEALYNKMYSEIITLMAQNENNNTRYIINNINVCERMLHSANVGNDYFTSW